VKKIIFLIHKKNIISNRLSSISSEINKLKKELFNIIYESILSLLKIMGIIIFFKILLEAVVKIPVVEKLSFRA